MDLEMASIYLEEAIAAELKVRVSPSRVRSFRHRMKANRLLLDYIRTEEGQLEAPLWEAPSLSRARGS